MNRLEFLKLAKNEQVAIIEKNFSDYHNKAYDDTCIGLFCEISDDQIEDYVEYPDEYGTFEILQGALSAFTEERAMKIRAGASLTREEEIALKKNIADCSANWTGVHGWSFQFNDGELFIIFWGHTMAGGIHLELAGAFASQDQAHKWLHNLEVFSYI